MKRSKLMFVLVPIILALVISAYWYSTQKMNYDSTKSTIEFIQKHYNSRDELVDNFDEIGVDSVDDIKLLVSEKEVKIQFGKLMLTWDSRDFITKENQELLSKIYIKIYKDEKTGKLRVFYKGQEIERWVS